MDERQVVVIGAGFAGLEFCKRFTHPAARVTVIDRTNHHLFQPLLYQVATGGLSATDIAQPIRSILARKPRLEVFMDEVRSIDLASRVVHSGKRLVPFDYLVVAPGSVTGYFGQREWSRYAPGLKTVDDALLLRRKLLLAFEMAENERDPARQAVLTTTVIIGGGPTGVELAGACAELAHRVLRKDFDNVDPTRAQITLLQGGDRVLNTFAPALSEKAEEQLRALGVRVRTGCRVEQIGPEEVRLSTGEIMRAGNIVWAAGVIANPLTASLGVPLGHGGRILVGPDLTVPGHSHVFVVGDAAAAKTGNGELVPGVAPAAMQMARYAARVIARELDSPGNPPTREVFRYHDKGSLATIGRSAGVAQLGKVKFSGFTAWIAWLVVHLLFLIGLKNKISVLSSWIYNYFTYKLGARIITGIDDRSS